MSTGGDGGASRQQPANRERPNWILVVGLSLLGVILLLLAWLARSQYWQSLLLNLGTTVVLFAGLALVQERLLVRIKRTLGLTDAQQQLRGSFEQFGMHALRTPKEELIEQAVRRVGAEIVKGGLVQDRGATESGTLVFRDPQGHGISWEIGWRDGVLRHVVEGQGVAKRWPEKGEARIALGRDSIGDGDLRMLKDFEDQVPGLLVDIAQAISARRSGA